MTDLLSNIRIFMRAAERGSFAEAARMLRISSAVASYNIKTLERHLGCDLFIRTTRRISLTEAGRAFYERCTVVMEALERAEAAVADRGGNPRNIVKMTAPLGLGRRVIAPALGRFSEQASGVEVRLRLSDHLLDLVQEAVDVAVRMANLEDSSFTQRKIADVRRVICASPDYLDRRGAPANPDDLLQHACLLLRFPGSRQFRWTLESASRTLTVPVTGPIDADDGDVLTDWALAGRGLVMKPLFEVARPIAEGRLKVVLEKYPPLPVTLALLSPTRRMFSRRMKSLLDEIHDQTRRHISTELSTIGESARAAP